MPIVRANGVVLKYEIKGRGEPLVLISDLGSDMTTWGLQVAEFAYDNFVISFDNRGVGGSDAPDGPYSVEMLAQDTLALMDVLGVEQAHVLGTSLGGMVGLEMAVSRPNRVRSLTLAATSARMTQRWRFVMETALSAAAKGVDQETITRFLLPWTYSDHMLMGGKRLEGLVKARAVRARQQSFQALASQIAACSSFNGAEMLGKVRAPTLVIAGKHDLLTPIYCSEELVHGIAGARLEILEGGHGLHTEAAEAFNVAVMRFLREVDGRK